MMCFLCARFVWILESVIFFPRLLQHTSHSKNTYSPTEMETKTNYIQYLFVIYWLCECEREKQNAKFCCLQTGFLTSFSFFLRFLVSVSLFIRLKNIHSLENFSRAISIDECRRHRAIHSKFATVLLEIVVLLQFTSQPFVVISFD